MPMRLEIIQNLLFYFFFFYSGKVNALGDISVVYDSLFVYSSFFVAIVIILKKIKSKTSIFVFLISFIFDCIISSFFSFSDNKWMMILLSVLNVILLFLYIFLEVKRKKNIQEGRVINKLMMNIYNITLFFNMDCVCSFFN